MQKITYFLLFTLLFLTMNGCTGQLINPPQPQNNISKSYSLEALALRYQQRGY